MTWKDTQGWHPIPDLSDPCEFLRRPRRSTVPAAEWCYLHLLPTLLSGLAAAIVGAVFVYYFGQRHLEAQRRLAFRERQLTEFYAALAGLRKQIQAKSELRQKVSDAANAAWQETCQSFGDRPMPDHEQRFVPYKSIIEYDNKQLNSQLVAKYREMLALFTERYQLAAPETRQFYKDFLEYVEIWNRWLADSVPPDVVEKLGRTEETVKLFYDHLELKMQQLRDEIASG